MTGSSQAGNPAPSSPLRLIVAHAGPVDEAARQALAGLRLPHLSRLLARLAPMPEAGAAGTGTGAALPARSGDSDDSAGLHPELSLSLPHELALARALGLPARDGRLPWAAWREALASAAAGSASASTADEAAPPAFARFTPCHWAVGSDHIAMRPPEVLQLDEGDSRALLAAMTPYFTEDGLAVDWQGPLHWRARGDMLRALPCASLDRVVGRTVDDWLPRVPEVRPLRRLQQEMQMLLYTHPVNEARERAGLLPVNSFWVDGAGALPTTVPAAPGAAALPTFPAVSPVASVRVDDRLREPALQGDAAAWVQAWQALDAQVLPPLLAALDRGEAVRLTLAGEKAAATWQSSAWQSADGTASGGWLRRLAARLRTPRVADILEPL